MANLIIILMIFELAFCVFLYVFKSKIPYPMSKILQYG